MTLWLRARRVPYLVATIFVVGLLELTLAGRTVVSPVLVGHAGISLWSMFLPVAVGVAFADSIASKTQSVEARVAGRVVLLDVGLLAGVACIASVTLAACGGTHPQLSGTVGQVLIAVGLSAATTLRWGLGAGVLSPVALAITCLGYGVDAPAGEFVRLLAPDSPGWWDLTVGCSAVGLAAFMIASRTVRVDLREGDRLGP